VIDDPRYPEGVKLFQEQQFFEAHEVLEGAWRALPAGDDKRFLQGLIQAAVSLEHWRRANPRGARGQYDKARGKLEGLPAVFHDLDVAALLRDLRRFYAVHDLGAAVAEQMAGRPVAPGPRMAWPAPVWRGVSIPGV
jgi:hypothetical protein